MAQENTPFEYDLERLRRFPYRLLTRLQKISLRNADTGIPRILHQLTTRCHAARAHLFMVHGKGDERRVSLKYCSSNHIPESVQKFPYGLLPDNVQQGLEAGRAILLRASRPGLGGDMLEGVLELSGTQAYLLCPLLLKDNVRGLLGIATDDIAISRNREVVHLLRMTGIHLFWGLRHLRREAAQQKRFAEWRRIANQACDLALTVDHALTITRAVAPGRTTLPWQIAGRRLTDLVERTFQQELLTAIERATRSGKVRTANFRMQTPQGASRWHAARIEPMQAPTGSVTLYLTDNHDDQLKQEEIRAMQMQLRRSERLRLLGKMSTEFAHQLNQPMQAMLAYCNTLQRRVRDNRDNPTDSLRILKNIESAIEHSNSIIGRIREFVRDRQLTITTTSLDDMLEKAILLVQPTAQFLNGVLLAPASPTGLEVNVDSVQTAHVLVNLMVNALEACRDAGVSHPQVSISVEQEDDQLVTVRVRDNGPGLPPEMLEDAFREFQSGKADGVGIGLSTSRDICRAQGGDLTAANNSDGTGCTFSFTVLTGGFNEADTVEMSPIRIDRDLLS